MLKKSAKASFCCKNVGTVADFGREEPRFASQEISDQHAVRM